MEVTITSPYLIVQPFIPTTNVPQLFKNGIIKRKRESTKRGADLKSQNIHFMEHRHGQHHACVDFNPTLKLAVNPVRRLRIWALFLSEPSAACCCNYRRQKEDRRGGGGIFC
jgi:hypothetical protein